MLFESITSYLLQEGLQALIDIKISLIFLFRIRTRFIGNKVWMSVNARNPAAKAGPSPVASQLSLTRREGMKGRDAGCCQRTRPLTRGGENTTRPQFTTSINYSAKVIKVSEPWKHDSRLASLYR